MQVVQRSGNKAARRALHGGVTRAPGGSAVDLDTDAAAAGLLAARDEDFSVVAADLVDDVLRCQREPRCQVLVHVLQARVVAISCATRLSTCEALQGTNSFTRADQLVEWQSARMCMAMRWRARAGRR